jgi:hypothetical protein
LLLQNYNDYDCFNVVHVAQHDLVWYHIQIHIPHCNLCLVVPPYLGHVTDLKDFVVTQVALGKAHAVALTNKGRIFTFGINNKGQCGRDFTPGAVKEGTQIIKGLSINVVTIV